MSHWIMDFKIELMISSFIHKAFRFMISSKLCLLGYGRIKINIHWYTAFEMTIYGYYHLRYHAWWHLVPLPTMCYCDIYSLSVGVTVYCRSTMNCYLDNCSIGVSSDLDGCRGALKREIFFHTFLCVLIWTCNQTSSNQHLLVVGCWNFV